jgi:hypothetical protein
MGSSPGAPSPGAALLASSGGGGAEEWEEFQKRYRLLGIDDGGIDARPNEPKESSKKDNKEKKASTSRTPRLSKGRIHADLLNAAASSSTSSTSTSSSTSDATKKEKEREKKEKKEKKSAKRESKKEAKKEKKEKRRSRIVRRESTDVGTESACGGSSGSECEDGGGEGAGSTIIGSSSSGSNSDKVSKKVSSGLIGEKRGLGHRVRMSMRLGSREDVSAAATATAGSSSPPPTEHGSLRLPLSARRGVNPLLLGSFPHRAANMDRAVSDEVESGPLTAGRRRLASSPARVQVGRWERRTFHSGEVRILFTCSTPTPTMLMVCACACGVVCRWVAMTRC